MLLQLTLFDNQNHNNKKKLFLDNCFSSIDNSEDLNFIKSTYSNLEDVKKYSEICYDAYIKVIPEISKKLNKIHSRNYSIRYWEHLIGPWLWFYICVLHERFSKLIQVENIYSDIEVRISQDNFIFSRYIDLYKLIQSDEYNFFIYSEIIKNHDFNFIKTKINSCKASDFLKLKLLNSATRKNTDWLQDVKFNLRSFFKIPKIIINIILRFYGTRKNKFINVSMPIGNLSLKVSSILKQINFHYKAIIMPNFSNILNEKNRLQNVFVKSIPNDPFLNLLDKIIIRNIPIEYLENYNENSKFIQKFINKKKPNVIGLRHSHEVNSQTRFLVSEYVKYKTKIISCQEGGGQGARIINLMDEKMYSRLCDLFLTWGWKSKNLNSKPFYFTKLFWVKGYKYNKKGHILFLGASFRKYFYSYNLGQLPSYNETQLKLNSSFIKLLDNNIINDFIYRFHWQFGFKEIEFFQKEFPNLKVSSREKESHFYNVFFESKLIIISTDYTTIKQSFYVNHPTVLLWDKDYFTVRDEAKDFYDSLHKVGILFYDSKKCADHVNMIANNPMDWWSQPDVQKAKDKYMKYFANKTNDLEGEISKCVKSFY